MRRITPIDRARDALGAGSLDAADALCRSGLEEHPDNAELLVLRGRIATRRGDHAAAVDAFGAALRASGGDPTITSHLYTALFRKGDGAAALALVMSLARALGPDDWEGRHKLMLFALSSLNDDYAAAKISLVDEAYRATMPIRLRIETASACNLRCQHCPTGVHYDATERTIMRLDLFERLLDQMQSLPSLRECVLYLGGEPLMNRNLVEMCRRVKEETTVTRTFITTNGMLLTEKNCAALAQADLNQIYVSVDGYSPQENDAIRVRARYTKIVENVARLRKHLEGTGTRIIISHAVIRRPGDPDTIRPPEFLVRDFPGIPIWSDYATRWPGFELDRTQLEAAQLGVREPVNFCGYPFAEMAVRVTGDVVLCCHDLLGESVMGNVWQSDLLDIWNGAAYRDLRRHMVARNPDGVHDVCKRCYVFTGERIERSPMFEIPAA